MQLEVIFLMRTPRYTENQYSRRHLPYKQPPPGPGALVPRQHVTIGKSPGEDPAIHPANAARTPSAVPADAIDHTEMAVNLSRRHARTLGHGDDNPEPDVMITRTYSTVGGG
jgi:hypothetical protein